MTDNNHPMTPPPELVRQWATTNGTAYEDLSALCQSIATQAARCGADMELEACCEWLDKAGSGLAGTYAAYLRAARRPKLPSLKEKASQIVDCLIEGDCLNDDDAITLRQVVESLPS